MFNRKELKKVAKKNIKHHYLRNVVFVFICTILLSSNFSNNDTVFEINYMPSLEETIEEINNETTNEIDKSKEHNKYYDGVLAVFFNETTSSGSLTFGILNGFNELIFKGALETAIIIILSNIVVFVFKTLFIDVILIGKKRYFLEQRRYRNTKIDKLLFSYKVKKTFKHAYILFIRSLYQILWSLTIVGGFIKYYEYKFIPYILAENPNITKKEAFRLSKELAFGEKLNLFKVDMSLIGWSLLEILTFRLSGIFYSNIYTESLYAEIYMDLSRKKKDSLSLGNLLNDELLEIKEPKEDSYPEGKYIRNLGRTKKWLKTDYNQKYLLQTYILFFFTFSCIGWLWEVFHHLINHGVFVNRGTLHGPWLQIYGFGGVAILVLLKKFRDKPFRLFTLSFILCGIIEYVTAWYLETFNHLKYWDYTGYFLNLHGRICLEGLLLFAIGGMVATYVIAPLLNNFYKKINPNIKTVLCIILITLFTIDFIYSSLVPNTGKGISKVALVEEYNNNYVKLI